MTDTRQSRSEHDRHIAKVIPLRRSTLSVDPPASDLSGLVQRAGTTFTELVAMAEDYASTSRSEFSLPPFFSMSD